MEDQKQDVLGVTMSPLAFAHLQHLVRETKWTFGFSIVLSLLALANSFLYMLIYDAERFRASLALYLEIKLHFWVILVASVVLIWQWYFYRLFVRRAAAALQAADGEAFSQSFGVLRRSNRLAIVNLFISTGFVILELIATLGHFLRTLPGAG